MNTTTLSLSRPSLRWIAAGLAAGLLAATVMGAAAAPTQAQSEEDETRRTLSVSGVGRVNAAPDVADVSLGVFEQGEDAAEASQKAAASMESVVQAMLDLGIDEKDVQTTSINLSARYDWNKEPAQIVGWEARNMVNVTVRDIEGVGDVVDAVVDSGANQINGISFRVEDPTEAQELARTAADEDAPHRVPDKPLKKKRGFTEGLSAEDHRVLARFFAAARRGRESSREPRCREILTRILRDLSESEIDERVSL